MVEINQSDLKLNRSSYPFLPLKVNYSPKERDIYYVMAKDVPNKEFSVLAEKVISQIAKEELDVVSLDLKLVTLATFYKRTVAMMDKYFDLHRSEFQHVVANENDLFSSLLRINVNPDKYNGLEFKVGDLLSILRKALGSAELYNFTARETLNITFKELVITATKALSHEGKNINNLRLGDVERIKSETNLPHARMMFDIVLAPYSEHPRYNIAKKRFESAKMAYQIKNDLLGINEDHKNSNANYYIAGAVEYDEFTPLLNRLGDFEKALCINNSIGGYCEVVEDTLPKTCSHWKENQEILLSNAQLETSLNNIVSI